MIYKNTDFFDESTREGEVYVLHLYVTGATPNSIRAITNIKSICKEHLKGRFKLEITDVYKNKELAAKDQLVALPALFKLSPAPERKLIGDLSDTQKVLVALGLSEEA